MRHTIYTARRTFNEFTKRRHQTARTSNRISRLPVNRVFLDLHNGTRALTRRHYYLAKNIKRRSRGLLATGARRRISVTRLTFSQNHSNLRRFVTDTITITIISTFRIISVRRRRQRQLRVPTNRFGFTLRHLIRNSTITNTNRQVTRDTLNHHTMRRNITRQRRRHQ